MNWTQIWIGGKEKKTNWTWITGSDLNYSDWAPKQPSDLEINKCADLNNESWYTRKCDTRQGYVCEKENPYEDCFEPNWGRYQLQDSDEVRCFMVNEDKWTWYGARKDCRERSGDLVTIDTFKDWVIVQSAVTGKFKPNSTYWFGLVQQTWVWSTGDVIKSSLWADFEPNLEGDIEKCMTLDCTRSGPGCPWDDDKCDMEYNYICQIDTTVTTTPLWPQEDKSTSTTTKKPINYNRGEGRSKDNDTDTTTSVGLLIGIVLGTLIVIVIIAIIVVLIIYRKKRNKYPNQASASNGRATNEYTMNKLLGDDSQLQNNHYSDKELDSDDINGKPVKTRRKKDENGVHERLSAPSDRSQSRAYSGASGVSSIDFDSEGTDLVENEMYQGPGGWQQCDV